MDSTGTRRAIAESAAGDSHSAKPGQGCRPVVDEEEENTMRLSSPFSNSNAFQLPQSGLQTNGSSKGSARLNTQSTGSRPQNSPALSFSAVVAKAQSANPVAHRSTVTRAAQATVIHTPFGPYDPDSVDPVYDVGGGTRDQMRVYFMTHSPALYMRDADSMSEFSRLYGPQAVAILKHFGTVPENIDPNSVSTPEQRAFYNSAGARAYYTPTDLIMMSADQRAKYITISNQALVALFWSDPERKISVTGTPVTWPPTQLNNGRA